MEKSKFVMPRLSHNRAVKYAVLDCETEGLSLHLHRPWEIAIHVQQGNKTLESKVLYPWFPDLQVGAMAAKITGFQWEKYKDLATPKEDVWEEVASYLYSSEYLIVGHNYLGFDSSLIRTLALSCGNWRGWNGYIEKVIDTLCLARMFHDGTKPSAENFLGDQMKQIGKPKRGAKKANLSALCKEFGIEVDATKTHQGEYDTFLTGQVLNKLIYVLDI